MIRVFNHYLRRQTLLQVLLDLGLIALSVIGIHLLHPQDPTLLVPSAAAHGLLLSACLLVVNTASGLYQPTRRRSLNHSVARASLTLILMLAATYLIFGLAQGNFDALSSAEWVAMLCVAGIVAHRVYAAHADVPSRPPARVLIFGSGEAAQMVGQTLRECDPQARVVGYFPGPNETGSVIPEAELLRGRGSLRECAVELGVDEIVVALAERRGGSMPLRELLDCKVGGIRVTDLAGYFEKMLCQIRIDHVRAGWLIFGDGFQQGTYRSMVKRAFDVLCAGILLIVSLPMMVLTAVAIKLESRGPVFYRQERVGLNGSTFRVLKFRSMRVDAETDGKPRWAAAQDSRVTRVGAIIRRFRIDEIPQLLNVFEGDMSMVGPRPERPFFVEQLTEQIPYYALRHSVKPGVTGWAQVRYQYGSTVADSLEKLQYDLYYVKNHTLFLDMVILFETVGVVLSGKGAR
ncbi:TIGR03013 family PEP-CTERM/XrtA system glycosyltransferase [Schlegelella sp. ID0723]|uniref:TIGR03013 family PEP-CTERM/XrtA system glycosyltransferase n=2 Tax=Piscinibacter koreensis TaxID=2742824 RepID=A0A7Y6NKY4_9BURK|nr:TIGR03013 family PEP-CTERM/XrtA system glycosyltransferase [Schlegelella koreensis]